MTIATVSSARDLSRADELPVELIDDLPNAADDASASSRAGFGDSFDRIQAGIQGWLRHWEPQRLPAFTAVRDVSPESDRGRSALQAAPTQADGAVRITAALYDPPNREGEPLSWSRNWASVAVLPPAREAGRLYYRFSVSSRLVLDGQASLSLVSTNVNFGVVADAAKASPFHAAGSRPRSHARSSACSAARTRMRGRHRSSRARSPYARAIPRRWRSSSAPTCCSRTAGFGCTRAPARGSARPDPAPAAPSSSATRPPPCSGSSAASTSRTAWPDPPRHTQHIDGARPG